LKGMIRSQHENRKPFAPNSLKIPTRQHRCNKVANAQESKISSRRFILRLSDQPAEMQAEKSLKMHGGSSKTADAKLALSAAQMLAKKLKSGLPITSPANTRRNVVSVRFPKSGSRT
jgi:hypothetical protein